MRSGKAQCSRRLILRHALAVGPKLDEGDQVGLVVKVSLFNRKKNRHENFGSGDIRGIDLV